MDIETLLAKQEITDLVSRYMRGLDRLDKSLLRSTFYDDANTDYGFFKGGPDDFVDMAHNALKEHLANHHMIGQCLIDVEGDVAFGEIYFQAFHRIITDGEERDLFIAGRYVDRYERRVTEDGKAQWKIAFRSEVNDWASNHPATDHYFKATPDSLRGGRLDDASYARDVLRDR